MMKISHGLAVAGVVGGVIPFVAAAPAAAAPDGPLLSGTYSAVGQYRAATATAVLHISSKCPGCDAVATAEGNTVALKWTGAGWMSTTASGGCGPTETIITPSNPTGLVQNYTSVMTYLQPELCGTTEPGLANATRIGD
jgi:hypothetical protein